MRILGITIDAISRADARERMREFLSDGRQHFVTTPNPEIVLSGYKDPQFAHVLNQADCALPDGIGLVFASWFLGTPIKERVTGSDFVIDLANIAAGTASIYLVGGKGDVAKRAAKKLRALVPGVQIVGAEEGIDFRITNTSPQCSGREVLTMQNDALILRINAAKPAVLLVAFGHPKQETWLCEHLSKLSSVKIGIGVGGAFDFLAGTVRRAPKLFRVLGIEWFWRLIVEPKRWRRIWNAVVVFPMAVISAKIHT